MPKKHKSQAWDELKKAGNERFKTGQYGEATELYSQAIKELEKTGKGKSPEDLSIIYSNRAASYLKDGNCTQCIQDCNTSLDLVPFNVKSLLRRAAAYEALERYRLAYVDYKTALAVDNNIPSAHDGTSRMTKVLMEMDGLSWREKLPAIPTVTLTMKQAMLNACHAAATENGGETPNKAAAPSAQDVKKGQTLKEEGNALVKKGEHQKAVDKYTQSLKHNPTEVTTYTNRALCYLSLKQPKDAVRDCDKALWYDSSNVKALYRRAQAHRQLKDNKACEEDLIRLLKVEPKNTAALNLMQELQKEK